MTEVAGRTDEASRSLVAAIVAAAFFMQNLDATVITTALPAMAGSFGVEPVEMGIGITAYMVAVAAFLPMSGWMADRFGARNVFGAAVAVFTLASVFCAYADTLTAFIAARVLQGAAGAMMMPVGRLVVLRNTRNADLVRAIATITWPGLVAPVIGPPLGGLITTYASWEWIFLLNLPLGAIGVVMVVLFIPNEKSTTTNPFDLTGFLLAGAALVCCLYGLESLAHGIVSAPFGGALAVGGLLLGYLATRHLRMAANPLLDLGALSVPTFAVTALGAGTLFRVAIGATPFLLPLFFQLAFGLDPFQSGLLVLAYMGGNLAMKSVTTPILRRFGFRAVLIGNGAVVGFSIAALAVISPETPIAMVIIILVVAGFTRSMQFTGLATLAFADVPSAQRSSATTLSAMSQQVGQMLGVATGAFLLTASQTARGSGELGILDFQIAFLSTGLLALISIIGFRRLHSDAGSEVSGHNRAHDRPA